MVPWTKIPGDIGLGDDLLQNCALDKMVHIGDNGPVHILSWFFGSKSGAQLGAQKGLEQMQNVASLMYTHYGHVSAIPTWRAFWLCCSAFRIQADEGDAL